MKVAVLGAAGGIGGPSPFYSKPSFLQVLNSLYDIAPLPRRCRRLKPHPNRS